MPQIIFNQLITTLREAGTLETEHVVGTDIGAAITTDDLLVKTAIPLTRSKPYLAAKNVSVILMWSAITGTAPVLNVSCYAQGEGETYNALTSGATSEPMTDNFMRGILLGGAPANADELVQTLNLVGSLRDQTLGTFFTYAENDAPEQGVVPATACIVRLHRASGTWTTATLDSMRVIVTA